MSDSQNSNGRGKYLCLISEGKGEGGLRDFLIKFQNVGGGC